MTRVTGIKSNPILKSIPMHNSAIAFVRSVQKNSMGTQNGTRKEDRKKNSQDVFGDKDVVGNKGGQISLSFC